MIAMGVSMMNKNGASSKNGLSGRGQISVEEVRLARDMWISAVQRLSVTETVALYDTSDVRLLGTVDTEGIHVRARERQICGWICFTCLHTRTDMWYLCLYIALFFCPHYLSMHMHEHLGMCTNIRMCVPFINVWVCIYTYILIACVCVF